jgi:DNA-binding NarL/FixJ family response regulator
MEGHDMIRVVIADDHHLVRQGIRALLEKAGDIEIVGKRPMARRPSNWSSASCPTCW